MAAVPHLDAESKSSSLSPPHPSSCGCWLKAGAAGSGTLGRHRHRPVGGCDVDAPVLTARRATLVQEPAASLRSLAINFPRLTLGGFRGLLATALWYQAESDKEQHKWMDLETKYDIIGAIEPYFVTIYIFHSWNQAYNLSAQWHEQDSKYKWVLDGLAYLYKGEQYNPDNPDLIFEEGNLYFLKLGGSFERIFFRAHSRADLARLHELSTMDPKDTSDSTEALKLVKAFVDRPTFHTQEMTEPSGRNTPGYGVSIVDPTLFDHRADGKASKEPVEFRYGLSPYYFGYAEFKRCLTAGMPTTMGPQVVDGWPGMSLRLWCRDDIYYSQQTMDGLFDAESPTPMTDVLTNETKLNAKIAEIRDCYRNVQMIAPKAIAEFENDMLRYPTNRTIHPKHINETLGYEAIAQAESKLFEALVKWQSEGRKMSEPVKDLLKASLPDYETAIAATYKWVDAMYPVVGTYVNPDRSDFERYVSALKFRKAGIENLLRANAGDKLDMTFLQEEVVER